MACNGISVCIYFIMNNDTTIELSYKYSINAVIGTSTCPYMDLFFRHVFAIDKSCFVVCIN